jgi:hypothetical protein
MRVFQLRDRAEIARLQLGHVRLRLALKHQQVSQAFRRIARRVVHGRIRLHRAGHHAHHGDAAGKGVGDRLPHEHRVRRRIARFDGDLGTISAGGAKLALRGDGV